MPRPGGNPDIAQAGEHTRWPAVAKGEPTVAAGVRLPVRLLERLDQLPTGTRAAKIRAAIEMYLEAHTNTDTDST